MMLAAEGQHEPDRRSSSSACSKAGADRVQQSVGPVSTRIGMIGDRHQGDGHQDCDDHNGGESGKHPRPERNRPPHWPVTFMCPLASGQLHRDIVFGNCYLGSERPKI
jgi:hypothetical protein